jgi:zinc transport system permease protein
LIGDGMGHVALAGVAIGVLLDQQPLLTALVAALAAGIGIELIRMRGRTSGDVALAIMFYGGIAAGVVIINKVDGSQTSNLTGYLFGAITTTTPADLVVFGVLSAAIVVVTTVLRQRFFAVAGDEEYARASGLPVVALNLLLAASFRTAIWWASGFGVLAAVGGVVTSFYADTATGGTIVLLAIGMFLVVVVGRVALSPLAARRHRMAERHTHEHGADCGHPAVPHKDHVDYLHDGHRHAAHGGHYDEHHDDAVDEQTQTAERSSR